MKQDQFYLTSPHGWCGSTVMFHGECGYTSNLDLAKIHTRSEMQNEVDNKWLRHENNQEMPLSVTHVNAECTWRVDHQYVKYTYPDHKDPNDEYVLYRKGRWDGNDVSFASELGCSFDYRLAKTFCASDLQAQNLEGWVVVPKSHTDEVARRTLQSNKINRRKMISSAGVVGLRKKRKPRSSGKVRMNCPECGKIAWQYDPYTFGSCSDINCKHNDRAFNLAA